MSTSTFNSRAAYYHQAPVQGSAEMNWATGGPRKGIRDGQQELGLVMFDKAAIQAAIGSDYIAEAKLTLVRDATYGTDTVDITIAPLWNNPTVGPMTHEQCMDLAQRNIHCTTTVTGASSVIRLPGYWLAMMVNSGIDGILIYQEAGEGTSINARFTDTATLEITYGSGLWATPVWMRTIGAGDVISSELRSFSADMQEMLYYVNVRRAIASLSEKEFSSSNDYSYWPTMASILQDGIDDIYTAESKTAVTWISIGDPSEPDSPSNIILPNAGVINQIRNALEAPVSGGGSTDTTEVPVYGWTIINKTSTWSNNDYSKKETWSQAAPKCGYDYEYVTVDGEKVKQYNYRFCFWILSGLLAGKTYNTLKLRLTKNSGDNGNIQLLGVIINTMPSVKMSANEVMNVSNVYATIPFSAGETKEITLGSDVVQALKDGTIYGIGLSKDSARSNFSASATLIISNE